VYSFLRARLAGREPVGHATREHAEIDAALDDLARADPSGPGLDAAARRLDELVRHHVREEEGRLLPRAEEELGTGTLVTLIQPFNFRKRELLDHATELDPDQVETEVTAVPATYSEDTSHF